MAVLLIFRNSNIALRRPLYFDAWCNNYLLHSPKVSSLYTKLLPFSSSYKNFQETIWYFQIKNKSSNWVRYYEQTSSRIVPKFQHPSSSSMHFINLASKIFKANWIWININFNESQMSTELVSHWAQKLKCWRVDKRTVWVPDSLPKYAYSRRLNYQNRSPMSQFNG
jgi:hypothetical protein